MKFDPYQIVLRPQISEKALRLADKEGKYTFRVARQANKVEIRRAVEALFKVKVVGVNTISLRGKPRTVRWRQGRRLKDGDIVPHLPKLFCAR